MNERKELLLIGHSFIRRLQQFCFKPETFNLGLDPQKEVVNFFHTDRNNQLLATISLMNQELQLCNYWQDIPEVVYIEMGSNDLFNNRFQGQASPTHLADQLLEGVGFLKHEGVPSVIVGAAIPRTGDGRYGAASHIPPEEQNWKDLWDFEESSVTDTQKFNDRLSSRIKTCYQGVYFEKKKGFTEGWPGKLGDGVHLKEGQPQQKYWSNMRSMAINHFDRLG